MTETKNVQETVSEFLKKLRQDSTDTLSKAEKEVRGFVETLVEKRKITDADGRKIYN